LSVLALAQAQFEPARRHTQTMSNGWIARPERRGFLDPARSGRQRREIAEVDTLPQSNERLVRRDPLDLRPINFL
jgi:hypothetical protein